MREVGMIREEAILEILDPGHFLDLGSEDGIMRCDHHLLTIPGINVCSVGNPHGSTDQDGGGGDEDHEFPEHG